MFRQVVVQTWADGVTDEDKSAFVSAFRGLRDLPEDDSALCGLDVGLFPDTWRVVSMLDFADIVARPALCGDVGPSGLHRRTWRGEDGPARRGPVRMGAASVVGYHHVKIPRSRTWYVSVLGFEPDLEFVEAGRLLGAPSTIRSPTSVSPSVRTRSEPPPWPALT